MERQTYANTNWYLFLSLIALAVSRSENDIQITRNLSREITIYPDYKDMTIPVNIAPFNSSIADSSEHCLVIKGEKTRPQIYNDEGFFETLQERWKASLKENAGSQTELTIAKRIQGERDTYMPFHMDTANGSIDRYITYQLLALSNDMWNRTGIYQWNLENYDQSVVYEDSLIDYNCVNCHTFSFGNPDKMIFHMWSKYIGSMLIDGKKITRLNTETPGTTSNFVRMYWHPNGNYLATTVCDTYQNFFISSPNTLEVLDHNSDIVIYDVRRNEVFFCEALNSKDAWQIFSAFSPSGKNLYLNSTAAIDSISKSFRRMTYSLCRVDFDPETHTLGQQVDTSYSGRASYKSISFPRTSSDGKYLILTLQEYGGFSVWHKGAELYMIHLSDGKTYLPSEANSVEGENYHSWNHNNRWLVFSSRGLGGLYIRPFFTHIDDRDTAYKPFLLPQKNSVKCYRDLLWTYNLPESIQEKARVGTHAVMETMRDTKGIQVK